MKASGYSVVPLCSNGHTQAPSAYHRVGKRRFGQQHGLSSARIVACLNLEWRERAAQEQFALDS